MALHQIAVLALGIILSVVVNKCENTASRALYVSTYGNDNWSGTKSSPTADSTDGPLATLHEAVRRMKEKRGSQDTISIIYLREGTYFLNRPLIIDSVLADGVYNSIVIRNYDEEYVSLTGAKEISGFQPVQDSSVLAKLPEVTRPHLLSVSLPQQGITDFGQLSPGGFPRPTYPAPLELFFDDKPMQLARWPNKGWAYIKQSKATNNHFFYDSSRPNRWMNNEDGWLHGFWSRNWADSFVKINRIDTTEQKIETLKPHGTYGYAPQGRWYALNLLEEIDQPGEWYLDRVQGMLYFWPPEPIDDHKVYVSVSEEPLIEITNSSYIIFRGITFSMARGNGVLITGGEGNMIVKSVFRNIGNAGLKVTDGKNHQIIGCDFYALGEGGVILEGGDRLSLESGGHQVYNCYFHRFNRWVKSSRPAISLSGVGHRVSNNLIHDAPHTGIHLYGNNHEISNNEIFNVGMETGDVGAFYMGRDISMQGNIIQYNYFHNLGSRYKYGVKAIYLDDFASGVKIHGNIFQDVQQGILVNGGSGNLISSNLFIDAREGAVIAHRAESSFRRVEKTIRKRLENVNFRSRVWQEQYPNLSQIAEGNPEVPKFNSVIHNRYTGSKILVIRSGDKARQTISDNSSLSKPTTEELFSTTNALNLSTIKSLVNVSTDLPPIGIFQDSLRASWPNLDSLRTNHNSR